MGASNQDFQGFMGHLVGTREVPKDSDVRWG